MNASERSRLSRGPMQANSDMVSQDLTTLAVQLFLLHSCRTRKAAVHAHPLPKRQMATTLGDIENPDRWSTSGLDASGSAGSVCSARHFRNFLLTRRPGRRRRSGGSFPERGVTRMRWGLCGPGVLARAGPRVMHASCIALNFHWLMASAETICTCPDYHDNNRRPVLAVYVNFASFWRTRSVGS